MYCSKCGNKIEEGTQFCSKCGNSVSNNNVNRISEEEEKRKRNIKTIIVCVAVIAILFITIQLIVNSANNASEDYGSERATELLRPNN